MTREELIEAILLERAKRKHRPGRAHGTNAGSRSRLSDDHMAHLNQEKADAWSEYLYDRNHPKDDNWTAADRRKYGWGG